MPGNCKRPLYLGEVTNGQSWSGRPYQTLDMMSLGDWLMVLKHTIYCDPYLCDHSQMPRHLISDAHEWINEIPTVPIYYPAKPQLRERAKHNQRGKKTLLSLTLV